LSGKQKLLWLGEAPPPANVRGAARAWDLEALDAREPLVRQLRGGTLLAVGPDGRADDPRWLSNVLDALDRTATVGVFLMPRAARVGWAMLSRRSGSFLCVDEDAPASELASTFAAAASLQPAIRDLRLELTAGRPLSAEPGAAAELDEEMRLASRLQRDFLPRTLPEVGPVRFGVLYRPATWVSGDIYDVARLDETHVGFYVADAVGHGMPAALLTMFVKKALQTKRIVGNSYEIVPPHVSLEGLNRDICEQNLSSCQFCTAVYCVVDTAGLTVTYARAGHPDPLVVRPSGEVRRATARGGLLGIFPEETFELRQVQLDSGDRFVVYSDGAEEVLCRGRDARGSFSAVVAEWAGVGREEMLADISERIAAARAAVGAKDDITVVVMDVA
jgi:hypothetical protein